MGRPGILRGVPAFKKILIEIKGPKSPILPSCPSPVGCARCKEFLKPILACPPPAITRRAAASHCIRRGLRFCLLLCAHNKPRSLAGLSSFGLLPYREPDQNLLRAWQRVRFPGSWSALCRERRLPENPAETEAQACRHAALRKIGKVSCPMGVPVPWCPFSSAFAPSLAHLHLRCEAMNVSPALLYGVMQLRLSCDGCARPLQKTKRASGDVKGVGAVNTLCPPYARA